MTVGQRIAQKRKELGLSQEGLGEQLGVSRQAIYKWESDAALPEIDKLITLSRIFSVSVGWLLGEEEPSAAGADRELTEEQLRMVQEIVDRYLAAQPKPEKPRRRSRLLILAAALVVVAVFFRLGDLDSQYQSLSNSVYYLNSNLSLQINSITNRVEQILNDQNKLTAAMSSEVKSLDLRTNTVTFSLSATPRTYREGMTARFVARSGEDTVQLDVQPGEGNRFSTDLTCPLTDDIELSVIFVCGDQQDTQYLDKYDYLYSGTFPDIYTESGPLWFDVDEKANTLVPDIIRLSVQAGYTESVKGGSITITDIKMGLFRDRDLMFWYIPEMRDIIVNGVSTQELRYNRKETVALEKDHVYTQLILLTDNYGRTWAVQDNCLGYDTSAQTWSYAAELDTGSDPSYWNY